MATIPLSIASYIRDVPVKSQQRSQRNDSGSVKNPKQALEQPREQAIPETRRLIGTPRRFEEYLDDPLIKESGRSNADGLLTSEGEARYIKPAPAPAGISGTPGQHALLESNSVSLMAALGAEVSHKAFPQPVKVAVTPAAEKQAEEKAKAKAQEAPFSAAEKAKAYAADPSVRNASEALKRRMLQLDPHAEKYARNLFATLRPGKPSGKLSAAFESGDQGIEAIGYDRTGGTSYGKYQIASRPGSMDKFIQYLDKQEPTWAEQLRKAGPSNTGSRKGKMPAVWKDIAKKHPKRFEQIQDDFILQSHYEPALKSIMAQNNVDLDSLDPAVKEVLLSTSVQHGPNGAAEIFAEAMSHAGSNKSQNFDEKLIKEIYESRSSDFPSSSQAVQRAVRSRLMREEALALTLLDENDVKRMF